MRGPGRVRVSSGKWLVDATGAASAKGDTNQTHWSLRRAFAAVSSHEAVLVWQVVGDAGNEQHFGRFDHHDFVVI